MGMVEATWTRERLADLQEPQAPMQFRFKFFMPFSIRSQFVLKASWPQVLASAAAAVTMYSQDSLIRNHVRTRSARPSTAWELHA